MGSLAGRGCISLIFSRKEVIMVPDQPPRDQTIASDWKALVHPHYPDLDGLFPETVAVSGCAKLLNEDDDMEE